MSTNGGNPQLALASGPGRWLLAATVLGSGMAFLDGTVVNVALPAIARDLGGGLVVQQWVLDGYLLTLSALLLLGGALGDRYGRRIVFLIGLVAFTVASVACGLAPTGGALIAARLLQGVGGALLVPGSLALINAVIRSEDRGKAVGSWAGLTGVASAVGPFVGGWLVDAVNWRWVFLLNIPFAIVAVWVVVRHVPESAPAKDGPLDWLGAVAVTLGLTGLTYALIEMPAHGWSPLVVVASVVGVVALVAFPLIELRTASPLLPMTLFKNAQFTGTNIVTIAVYGALGGAFFLLTLQLQQGVGYTALEAGLSTLPITIIMLLLSSRIGALAQRTGPRLPMTVGPIVAGVGLALMAMIGPGGSFWTTVLPGVLVFGLGLSITVAPLTSSVLAGLDEAHVGAGSGANNAISRVAGLITVAVLPSLAGVQSSGTGDLGPGFDRAMLISAALCVIGGLIALLTVRQATRVERHTLPSLNHGCQHPCTRVPIGSISGASD
jgi:EmrB/QacA subfamily drug resistance transporter